LKTGPGTWVIATG